jgi:hypothetical protein
MIPIEVALFLAIVNNRIIEAVAAPLKKKYPDLDTWWLIYVAWAVGGVLAWLSGVNLFADYLQAPLAGRILTAIVVGGGANLIADLFGDRPEAAG